MRAAGGAPSAPAPRPAYRLRMRAAFALPVPAVGVDNTSCAARSLDIGREWRQQRPFLRRQRAQQGKVVWWGTGWVLRRALSAAQARVASVLDAGAGRRLEQIQLLLGFTQELRSRLPRTVSPPRRRSGGCQAAPAARPRWSPRRAAPPRRPRPGTAASSP